MLKASNKAVKYSRTSLRQNKSIQNSTSVDGVFSVRQCATRFWTSVIALIGLAALPLSYLFAEVPEPAAPRCPDQIVCIIVTEFHSFTADSDVGESFEQAFRFMFLAALQRHPDIQLLFPASVERRLLGLGKSPDELAEEEGYRLVGIDFAVHIDLYDVDGGISLVGTLNSLTDDWNETFTGGPDYSLDILGIVSSFAANLADVIEQRRASFAVRKVVVTCFQDRSLTRSPKTGWISADLGNSVALKVQSLKTLNVENVEMTGKVCDPGDARALASEHNADAVISGSFRFKDQFLLTEPTLFIVEKKVVLQMPSVQTAKTTYLDNKFQLLEQIGEFMQAAVSLDGTWNPELLKKPGTKLIWVIPIVGKVKDLLHRATESLNKGDLNTAAVLSNEALAIKHDSERAHYTLGLVRFRQGRYKEAVLEFREAVTIDPEYLNAHQALGDSHVRLRDYNSAEQAYETMLELESDSVEAFEALGQINIIRRDYANAEVYYLEAARLAPNAGIYMQLATVANGQKDFDKALKMLRMALEHDPSNAQARDRLARTLNSAGRHAYDIRQYAEALGYYDQLIEARPTAASFSHRAAAYSRAYNLRQIQTESGYIPAIEDYRTAIQIDDENPGELDRAGLTAQTYLNLQELLLFSGKYKETVAVGTEYLSKEKLRRERVLVAHFHNVVALALDDKPYDDQLVELKSLIKGRGSHAPGWSFALWENYLGGRSDITDEVRMLIQDLISRIN